MFIGGEKTMSNKNNVNQLIDILKTTNDPNERNEVAIRLSDLRCNEAVPFVLELIKDSNCENNRGTLIYSLKNLALFEDQLMELLPLLNDGNFEVRCEVYELLKCYTDILKNNNEFKAAIEKMIDEEDHKLFVLEELYDNLTLSNEESEKDYPYNQFENSELWSIVKDCLNDLIDNQDIEITTKEEYVVGYLCKMIAERK